MKPRRIWESKILLLVSNEMKNHLETRALNEGTTISNIVRELILEDIERHKKQTTT